MIWRQEEAEEVLQKFVDLSVKVLRFRENVFECTISKYVARAFCPNVRSSQFVESKIVTSKIGLFNRFNTYHVEAETFCFNISMLSKP